MRPDRLRVTDVAQLADLTGFAPSQSGISEDVLMANALATIDAKSARKMLRKSADELTDDHGPLLHFTYRFLGSSATTFSVKPRKPLVSSAKPKRGRTAHEEQKYVRPAYAIARNALKGTPYELFKVHPYIPVEIIEAAKRQRVAGQTVLLIEGEKKALAAVSRSLMAIAIPGVECWGSWIDNGKASDRGRGRKELHPDLVALARAGARFVISFDADRSSNPNVTAAEVRLAEAFARAGSPVFNLRLPYVPGGLKGLDDFLVHNDNVHRSNADVPDGRAFVEALIQDAIAEGPVVDVDAFKADPKRPEILLSADEHEVNNHVIAALANDPDLYQRKNRIVRILADDATDAPRLYISPVGRGDLRDRITRWTRLREIDAEGNAEPAVPSDAMVRAVLERGQYPYRRLTTVTRTPLLAPDGRVIQTPGHDALTQVFYAPARDYTLVADAPTRQDALHAAHELLGVVVDSPFKGAEHRSAWLALVLTLVARPAIGGSTPLYAIDASTRSSGKTALAEAASLIAVGTRSPLQTFSADPAEQRKHLSTLLSSGERLIIFDNVVGMLSGGPINMAITGGRWGDRLLGKNEQIDEAITAVVVATGNNMLLGDDMDRRTQHIRLEPSEEFPELRERWTHPNLHAWLMEEHPRLLVQALTLLKAYYCAGKPIPPYGLRPWAGFESWSALVRGSLVWLGLADPIEARSELIEFAATGDDAQRRLVEQWHLLGDDGASAGEALRMIYPDVDKWTIPTERDPFPNLRCAVEDLCGGARPKSETLLGKRLAKLRTRRFGDRYLTLGPKDNGTRRWVVRCVGRSTPHLPVLTEPAARALASERVANDFAASDFVDGDGGHAVGGLN